MFFFMNDSLVVSSQYKLEKTQVTQCLHHQWLVQWLVKLFSLSLWLFWCSTNLLLNIVVQAATPFIKWCSKDTPIRESRPGQACRSTVSRPVTLTSDVRAITTSCPETYVSWIPEPKRPDQTILSRTVTDTTSRKPHTEVGIYKPQLMYYLKPLVRVTKEDIDNLISHSMWNNWNIQREAFSLSVVLFSECVPANKKTRIVDQ